MKREVSAQTFPSRIQAVSCGERVMSRDEGKKVLAPFHWTEVAREMLGEKFFHALDTARSPFDNRAAAGGEDPTQPGLGTSPEAGAV